MTSDGQSGDRTDYRAELFCPADDGPYWLTVEAPDGHERGAAEALVFVSNFTGPFEIGATVSRLTGRLTHQGIDGWHFQKDTLGPIEFWEVDAG